jgi:hypothetical protein
LPNPRRRSRNARRALSVETVTLGHVRRLK